MRRVRSPLPVLMLALVALAGACGKKKPAGGDAATDGGVTDGGGDGARDLAAERGGDGGATDGPVACNGRCAGNCLGVCTGICSERTPEGECAGRCEEICVGSCQGTCVRMARDGGGDGGGDVRDAGAADRRLDATPDLASDLAVTDAESPDVADAAAPPRWSDRGNTTTLSWPPAGHSGAMVYDSGRKKVMMFGGATAPGNATWEWDGPLGAWELRQQMAGERPSRRFGHALAYDATRGKVILYGGIDESGGSNAETWEWDGNAETWTRKRPGPSPSRWGHAMAYHAGMSRIVLFGGSYRHPTLGDGDLFDVWEYDSAADTWVNKTYPLPPAWPRARRGHALAYDAARALTVMYGGEVLVLSGPATDLWEWDSTTNLWTDRTPPALPQAWPGPRAWHGMAYTGQRVVLFGGASPNLWEWNGEAGAWSDLGSTTLPTPWPPPRPRAPLAWDSMRQALVVSGGSMMVGSNSLADLWEWSRP